MQNPFEEIINRLKAIEHQLIKIRENREPVKKVDDPTKEILSEKEVADILGVCTRTVRNRLKAREMEYIQIRGKRYVRSSELDRYLALYSVPQKKTK